MRLFQNSGIYPSYRPRFDRLSAHTTDFKGRVDTFLADRYGACHFLKPVLDHDPSAFFTNADDEILQRRWASEAGMSKKSSAEGILLAQIEDHRAEVFYNMDPMRFQSAFVGRLPGCVRKSIAWRAAPSPNVDFSAYDSIICNFPSILETFQRAGCRTASFWPAHDPDMDAYAVNAERPIDVLFVGGYTQYHRKRAELLEAVAALNGRHSVVMHLDRSRLTRLAEALPAWTPRLKMHRRPEAIRAASKLPVFGVDLYRTLSRAKIVLNGAIDMAGDDRGNMRCFEAMGCGALMLSDVGRYPQGMVDGQTMRTYASAGEAVTAINMLLADSTGRNEMAARGHRMLARDYAKETQWQAFQQLVGAL